MSQPRIVSAELADEKVIARTAQIMGPSSTSQQILDELRRRRADGSDVVAYDLVTTTGRMTVVGPRLEDAITA